MKTNAKTTLQLSDLVPGTLGYRICKSNAENRIIYRLAKIINDKKMMSSILEGEKMRMVTYWTGTGYCDVIKGSDDNFTDVGIPMYMVIIWFFSTIFLLAMVFNKELSYTIADFALRPIVEFFIDLFK